MSASPAPPPPPAWRTITAVDGADRAVPPPRPQPAWDASVDDRAATVRALVTVACPLHNAAIGEPCWGFFWPGSDRRPPVCRARADRVLAALSAATAATADPALGPVTTDPAAFITDAFPAAFPGRLPSATDTPEESS